MFAEKIDEIQMMYRSMESFESDNNDREVKMKISDKTDVGSGHLL